MINGYDILYALGLAISSPVWLIKSSARRKVLGALRERMGHVAPRDSKTPAVLIHAVSLGEINATRALVQMLREQRPDMHIIVSTTTQTGLERGRELYGSDPATTLIHYPLDFTRAIVRVLDRLRPEVVVLMELETWPNFIHQCAKRRIPVVLVNGRLTEYSFRHYRLMGPVTRGMFRRLERVCVQDEAYARRFEALGALPERIEITGTMKFDTAHVADTIPGADELAAAVDLRPGQEPIWICGSTGPGEEEIILRVYRKLIEQYPSLRLVIVPRHPQRFDEVAQLIERSHFPLIRRSCPMPNPVSAIHNEVVLGDTMGELRKFYAMATVVFVGRTLCDLGPRQRGSDMIEPAALAKPVIVGPFTDNFADAMLKLRQGNAIVEIHNEFQLMASVESLLASPEQGCAMGLRAQQIVRAQQGATARHVKTIVGVLSGSAAK